MGTRYSGSDSQNNIKKLLKKKPIEMIKSLVFVIYSYTLRYLLHFYFKYLKINNFFIFHGIKYKYFYHLYNFTYRNERCVEIAIAKNKIKENNGKKVLEVGNVLSHYIKHDWDILDKYEKGDGIINEDIIDFNTSKRYDFIISISTLEHIGRDDGSNNPEKIFSVIKKLKTLLTPGGKIFFTIPVGYNKCLDDYIVNKKLELSEEYFMERISKNNKWHEIDIKMAIQKKYNYPYNAANAIIIGTIK